MRTVVIVSLFALAGCAAEPSPAPTPDLEGPEYGEWALPVGSERDWPDLPCSVERFLKPHAIEFARPRPTRALDEYDEDEIGLRRKAG